MVSQIRRGVLDLIGAARPSIADPFLPNKIDAGETDDIRECIGCNICVSGDYTMSPIRCTQNPTMGEEWRKGWHPERIPPRVGDDTFLIVGAGPSGLECARLLGRRGHTVHLAEATEELGGRVTREARLPGLAAWARVRDYRVNQLRKLANVEIYRGSRVSVELILELGATRIVLATGARWRRDGVGRASRRPVPGFDGPGVFGPDEVIDGNPAGFPSAASAGGGAGGSPIVVFDDDHYYLGAVLAEKLRAMGHAVTLVTPAECVSAWTHNTLEQHTIQRRLLELGIEVLANRNVAGFAGTELRLECVYTGRAQSIAAAAVIPVTSRLPNEELALSLESRREELRDAGIRSVTSIGDALAPSTIAAAVYAGHRYAREFDLPASDAVAFAREP
jgi:dimethylamine/trimethylamine dehydrogenase